MQFLIVSNLLTENQGQDGSTSGSLQNRGISPGQLPRSDSTNSMDSTSTPRGEVEQPGGLTVADGAEKVKMGLMFQAKNLDERVWYTILPLNTVFLWL